MTKIKINPTTRTHGFMSIDVDIRNGQVNQVKTSGLLYRGFEKMLVNRAPLDAVYLTQRICGICSSAHAIASSIALEKAYGANVPPNGQLLRKLVYSADFLQNHIRHFYLLLLPDYVTSAGIFPFKTKQEEDRRLPTDIDSKARENHKKCMQISSQAHKMVALFGGKAPHLQGILPGGVTMQPVTGLVIRFRALLKEVEEFIRERMIPDTLALKEYYPDYFNIGKGYGNMISYGFPNLGAEQDRYLIKPGIIENQELKDFLPEKITQSVKHSWYSATEDPQKPNKSNALEENIYKDNAYSWIKAPRYEDKAYEGGPLARMWLQEIYQEEPSTMARIVARTLESEFLCKLMWQWLDELEPDKSSINPPKSTYGSVESFSLIDSMRGPLGHWLKIKNARYENYTIITPSAWNLSPKDHLDQPGPLEKALEGTPVEDADNPIELGRIIRSFDPCISCAVHVISPGKTRKLWQRIW